MARGKPASPTTEDDAAGFDELPEKEAPDSECASDPRRWAQYFSSNYRNRKEVQRPDRGIII